MLIDPNTIGGFEIGDPAQTFPLNGWSTVFLGSEKWYCANAANLQPVSCTGSGGAYIHNSGSTTLPVSYTQGAATICHLSRNITFPVGEGEIVLNFNYKGKGDGILDGLKIYIGDTNFLPQANNLFTFTDVSAVQIGNSIYNNKAVCTPAQIILNPALAGTSKRIVFSWVNNGDGLPASPNPVTIDDISLTSKLLVLPGCASVLAPPNLATTVCLNAVTLKWLPPTSLGLPTGYKLSYGLTALANDFTFNLGNVFSYNIGTLSANTLYYWKIEPSNSLGNAVGCPIWSFTTGNTFLNPSIADADTPIFTDFEDCSIWNNISSTQTNKWVVGTATSNGGANSIYISDNDGASNQYSSTGNTDKSVVHFYKDISFPAGKACIVLKFDLRTLGDSSLDFVPSQLANSDNLRIYTDTAGASYTPLDGVDPPLNGGGAAAGVKLLGEYYFLNNYTTITLVLNPLWAGTTKRIIFTWRNNGKDFLQTPAAIDNISIVTSVQPAPACVNILFPTDGLSDLCDEGQTLTWQPNITGCNTPTNYKIYFGTDTNTIPLVSTVLGNIFTYNTGPLLSGTAYYWRIVPLTGLLSNTSCPFSYFTTSATGTVNNFPCNAINVPLGASIDGFNGCTNSLSEPAAPASPADWTIGTLNTVWYKAVCPASGKLNIRIVLSTLASSQIAVYQGSCTSLTLVPAAYNVASTETCGSNGTPPYSELKLTGLTVGTTYYVVVDGRSNFEGNFSIIITDGGLTYPGSLGQDCILPLIPCTQTTFNFNPGFSSFGFLCDIPTAYSSPPSNPVEENNSTWYVLNIQSPGFLSFNIVPNDYGNPNPYTAAANAGYSVPGNESNYNYALWKFNGSLINCSTIAAHTTPPINKNTSAFGVTGLSATGNAPINIPPYDPVFDAAYEPSIAVAAGDIFYLLVTNNTLVPNVGFTIDFLSSPINYSIAAVAVTWTGGANNGSWVAPGNWGGCEVPRCDIDATINSSPINQPSLTTGTIYRVKNLTIESGAKLTLGANTILEICGDFENKGEIQADITSEIKFTGIGNQNISGSGGFSLFNKLGKLTISKTGGAVTQSSNIEVAGEFKTTNATSIFNTLGASLKLGGNFTNFNGNTSYFDPVGTSILEFYGGFGQNFKDPFSTTGISNIEVNKTSTLVAVTLLSHMRVSATASSKLLLTKGVISTGNGAFEVNLLNSAPTALVGGSDTSYVIGNLRRSIAALGGSYDFPVAHATKGYQKANIEFTTATAIPSLLARFDIWTPYTFPIAPTECEILFNAPSADNGYWTITASANPTSGTYNTTLYPKNIGNLGLSRSIIKASSSILGPWTFNGVCDTVNTTASMVRRTGMNGFSLFAIGQGAFPLPIELLSFTGRNEQNYNLLKWTTATEINNDYFEIERSLNGEIFEKIGELNGQGNSTTLVNYTFKDANFPNKLNYYRLKQIDFDGNYSYSDAISIDNSARELSSFSVLPNPFRNEFKVELGELTKGGYLIEIYNLMGQLVMRQSIECETKGCSTIFNTENLNAGSYCVKVLSEKNDYISSKIAIKN